MYADWVDACDEAAKATATGAEPEQASYRDNHQPAAAPKPRAVGAGGERGEGIAAEMDDFIEDDEMEGEGEFADEDD